MRLRSLQIREKNGFESQRRRKRKGRVCSHEFKIRALQHREKLFELAIRIAEAKLQRIQTPKIPNPPPSEPKSSEPRP